MTWRPPRALLAMMVGATSAAFPDAQQPTFRVAVDAVLVPAIVLDGRAPVAGLTTEQFIVTDRGVPQRISAESVGDWPIDVTFLVDVSGSTRAALDGVAAAVPQLASLLKAHDRYRVLVFDERARVAVPQQPAGEPPRIERLESFGATALLDALAQSLIQDEPAERRRLIVVFSDGADNASILDPKAVMDVVLHADAVLDVVLSRQPIRNPRQGESPWTVASREAVLDMAAATGGQTYVNRDYVKAFRQILSDFRGSYLLTFTPEGVVRPGWHEIEVEATSLNGKALTVRARRGYFGGR